jgi:hypothetical protein
VTIARHEHLHISSGSRRPNDDRPKHDLPVDARDRGVVHVGGQRFSPAADIQRRGYVPVRRLKRKEWRKGFRQSGRDRSTILASAHFQPCYCTWIRCQPTHPSPSARRFRLLLNGLATSALRRMFLQPTADSALLGERLLISWRLWWSYTSSSWPFTEHARRQQDMALLSIRTKQKIGTVGEADICSIVGFRSLDCLVYR